MRACVEVGRERETSLYLLRTYSKLPLLQKWKEHKLLTDQPSKSTMKSTFKIKAHQLMLHKPDPLIHKHTEQQQIH